MEYPRSTSLNRPTSFQKIVRNSSLNTGKIQMGRVQDFVEHLERGYSNPGIPKGCREKIQQ